VTTHPAIRRRKAEEGKRRGVGRRRSGRGKLVRGIVDKVGGRVVGHKLAAPLGADVSSAGVPAHGGDLVGAEGGLDAVQYAVARLSHLHDA